MTSLQLSRLIDAPAEEIWKLVFDPSRHPEWWVGVGAVDDVRSDGFVLRPEDEPALALEQQLRSLPDGDGVVVSCVTYGTRFTWRLTPAGAATRVEAAIDLPEALAGGLEVKREQLVASLERLADVARQQ